MYIFAASILKKMKKNELARILEANGCYLCRNGANHEIWYSPITKVRFPVPRHGSKEMATATVMKICKQSGVKLF